MSEENTNPEVGLHPPSPSSGPLYSDPKPAPTKPSVEETPKKALKVFKRSDIVRTVPVTVCLPNLYPDFAPWEFNLRLKMTQDAEERRQEYLALIPSKQTVNEPEQNLDELCDLITKTPTGFSDLVDDGKGPGSSFKNYVLTADPVTKDMLFAVVRGAMTLYWRKISPQEFRK